MSAQGENLQAKMKNMEFNPSIADQNLVIEEWWSSIARIPDGEVKIEVIKKFIVKMGFSPDLDIAEKTLYKRIGPTEIYTKSTFYRLFSKSVFKIALTDMLANIESLSKNGSDLPLLVKLSAFTRSLMLSGLDSEAEGELKQRGENILHAI